MLSGCFKHTYTYGTGGNLNAPPKYNEEFVNHFLLGIIGEKHVDVKSICPSGNATVKDYHSVVNVIIAALIGIVWHPTTIEVYCDKGETAQLTLTPEQVRELMFDPRLMEALNAHAPAEADRLVLAQIAERR